MQLLCEDLRQPFQVSENQIVVSFDLGESLVNTQVAKTDRDLRKLLLVKDIE